jgi:hypothetical protein
MVNNMNNADRNKKYTESKRDLAQELMNEKIKNQVMRKQLVFVRDMLDNILDDIESREELIIKYVQKHYTGLENLKRCINCQGIGNWSESFCSKCFGKDEIASKKEAQEDLDSAKEVAKNDLDKTKEENEKQSHPTKEETKINEEGNKEETK